MIELVNDEAVQEEQPFLTEAEVRFTVDDDQKAEWCLKKIRETNDEAEQMLDWYKAQAEKIKKRRDERVAFFEEKLKPYFGMVPHKVTKTQESYQLPTGKLVIKKQGPEYERDDDLTIAWLKAAGKTHLVNTKEVLNWMELKRELTIVGGEQVADENGEIVPGIIVHERPDVFKVEVSK